MLTVNVPIKELVTHIIHPTARQTVNRIIDDLGIRTIFENRIQFKGEGMSTSDSNDGNYRPKLVGDTITCELNTNLDLNSLTEDVLKTGSVLTHKPSIWQANRNVPFFFDSETLTSCVCHKMPMDLDLTITLSFKDRSVAYDVYTRLTNKYTWGGMQTLIDFIVTYPIPETIWQLLYMVNNMRGNSDDEFLDYLREYSNCELSVDMNRYDHKIVELVARDNTCNVLARIDKSSGKPEAVKENISASTYDITFDVKLQFERPDSIFMTYPIIINNTPIPNEAILTPRDESAPKSRPLHNMFSFRDVVSDLIDVDPEGFIRIPWYDTWRVPTKPLKQFGYKPFISMAFSLDNLQLPNGYTEIDLFSDLGGLQLDPEIIMLLRTSSVDPLSFVGYINVSVFSNFNIVSKSNLKWDNGKLRIYSKDPVPVYRIVLSEYSSDGMYEIINNCSYAPTDSYVEPGVVRPVKYIKYVQINEGVVKYIMDKNDELHTFVITGRGVYKLKPDNSWKQVMDPLDNTKPLKYSLWLRSFNHDADTGAIVTPDNKVLMGTSNEPWLVKIHKGKFVKVDTSLVRNYKTGLGDMSRFIINRKGVKYGALNAARIHTTSINV